MCYKTSISFQRYNEVLKKPFITNFAKFVVGCTLELRDCVKFGILGIPTVQTVTTQLKQDKRVNFLLISVVYLVAIWFHSQPLPT